MSLPTVWWIIYLCLLITVPICEQRRRYRPRDHHDKYDKHDDDDHDLGWPPRHGMFILSIVRHH